MKEPSQKAGLPQPDWCRVTLASIGDAVVATDTEGRVTFLNSVAESLTGWTLPEAAGQPLASVYRVISEENGRPVESPTSGSSRDGVITGPANYRRLIARDGTERPIHERTAPIRSDPSEVAGSVLVFRDLSELRQQEQQVQDALAYADNILATLREPFIVLEKDLRVRAANAPFYRTFQVSKGDTEGRFIYELGNRQWDIPRLRKLLEEVLPQNHSFQDFEVEHDFPSIGRKIMLLNARRFVSVNSHPELLLLAIEDITERRRAKVALQTSEAQYRRLFETAKDGILILDADTGKIVDANPFMTEMLGYPHDEFLGKELWEIGLFRDKSENEATFRELQRHGYVRYDHLPLKTNRGERAEVEFVSNVYRVDHRHVAQCNIRDISDRSRLERKTHEQASELVDLHRRKDEFLAILSHELRNPLAAISNAVQLLGLRRDGEDLLQEQARIVIERQTGQLKHLVDDLLDISRITTGRVRLRPERVAITAIVHAAVETVRPLIDQRRHELSVSLPPASIWLDADPSRLEQVLVNLLTNAAKYTDEGGHVWLSIQEEGGVCVLSVRDTGVGIAAEMLQHVFDLFTQVERRIDRSQGGLGIGLSLVKRLVELHGGTVEANSVQGQGSEFVVRLPIVSMLPLQSSSPVTEPVPRTAAGLRVLVVDDNVDMATGMALLLEDAGHDARTIHDGPTALLAAVDYRPDVVLLDIGLPGLNGYEIARRIRREPGLESVVLVALTGFGHEADRRTSMEAGFDYYLVKPTDFTDVKEILATVSKKTS